MAYHVGSKNERPGLTGFAHFFEHMMFRGTRNVPDFDSPLQQAGAHPNAFTSEDVTVYFESVSNDYVQRALYMEAERMAFLSSALDQQKFDTEREVVKNERRQQMENQPYGLADETISYHLYPAGHPYCWSVIGSMKDLNNASLDDLRQFFLEFYHPGNATLTVVGGFDPAATRQWIQSYFGVIAAGPPVSLPSVPPTPPVAKRVEQRDQVQFPRVYWTWPTVAESHRDAPALDLLAMILADGDASRLHQRLVVEGQVALDAQAAQETGELGGAFKMSATVAPGREVADVEAAFRAVLDQVRQEGVSGGELQRVQAKYRTDLLLGLTAPTQRAFVIAIGIALYDDPHYYQQSFQRYDRVTTREIQDVAMRYLVAQQMTLVVRPVAEGEVEDEAVMGGPLPDQQAREPLEVRTHGIGPDWTSMPDPRGRQPYAPPAIERRTLDNGLEVWLARWQTLPLVSVRLAVRAGSADPAPSQAGLAGLTAALWDQGTQQLTATQLAEAIDALGTSISISTDSDTTQVGFSAQSSALPPMLELLGAMVQTPRLADEDFAREKKLLWGEVASGPDSASWIAGRVLPMLVFGRQHAYALPDAGFEETLAGLTPEHVRAFYQQHFVPANSLLVVVGDIDIEATTQLLQRTLGTWQGPVRAVTRPAPQPAPAGTVYVVDKPGAVQSVIAAGRIWKDRRDPSYYATRIGNRVFGGDFLSRLNQNLRQRNGFTYGARSGFSYHDHGSNWYLTTAVRAEVTGAALGEIVQELRDAAGARPLTEQEVDDARSAEISVYPQSFETPASIAAALTQLAVYRLPESELQQFEQRLAGTSAADVARALTELADPRQIQLLIVGDKSQVVPQLQEAGFRTIGYLDAAGRAVQDN